MTHVYGKKMEDKFYKASDFAKMTWVNEADGPDKFALPDKICVFTTAPRRLTPEEFAELKILKAKKDLGTLGLKDLTRYQSLSRTEAEGPTPSGVEQARAYGTRLYPRETRSAIKMLQGHPSALNLLFAMTTCVGFGCVLNADRKKLLEITGFSMSTYTRALNVLLGLGLVLPNLVGDTAPQAGFVLDKELPTRKNGRRYKIAPFIAFRGPKDFQEHELRKYADYMKVRVASKITPVQDDGDGNPEFIKGEAS
jgi:hypothetical protein